MDVGGILVAALLLINLTGYAAGYARGHSGGTARGVSPGVDAGGWDAERGAGDRSWRLRCTVPTTIATIPTAAYTFGCMLTGTVLAVFWKAAARRESRSEALMKRRSSPRMQMS